MHTLASNVMSSYQDIHRMFLKIYECNPHAIDTFNGTEGDPPEQRWTPRQLLEKRVKDGNPYEINLQDVKKSLEPDFYKS